MSVQRWTHYSKHGVALEPDEGFAWMRVTDHERAMAEAHTLMGGAIESAIAQARADAIRECVAAVEAIDTRPLVAVKRDALAALRALLPEADA